LDWKRRGNKRTPAREAYQVPPSIGPDQAQNVPAAVSHVYTADVLEALAAIKRPVPHPADHLAEPIRQRHIMFSDEPVKGNAFRALRTAWWAYVEHADGAGLLDDDIRQRLTSEDDDAFRGALAECQTFWFFNHKLGIHLRRHLGVGGDFDDGAQLRVEVKAPYVPLRSDVIYGDDSDVLAKCIKKAGQQFDEAMMNIVVICPLLRTPVWMQRDQLVKACIGEWAISVPVSIDGSDPGEAKPVFWQNGKLAKMFPADGGAFSPDHRRVSAVATVEEKVRVDSDAWTIQHVAKVVHNPFAKVRLPETTFAGIAQLVVRDTGMLWVEG
jgi:hypothetical protein